MIDEYFESIDCDPNNMSAAEKLLAMFKNEPHVSYAYVTHVKNSGFVTCTKRGNHSETTLMQTDINLNQNSTAALSEIETESWRSSLKMTDSDQIMVAFAWCHDEENRKYKMFPEFLACDMTFGVNKEKRNLFICTGIDGYNKSFTAFRCFMPSKQKRAYKWAIGIAFPLLVGDSSKYLKVLVHDNKEALRNAIKSTIIDPSNKMPNVQQMLDIYHFFYQRWNPHVSIFVCLKFNLANYQTTFLICIYFHRFVIEIIEFNTFLMR